MAVSDEKTNFKFSTEDDDELQTEYDALTEDTIFMFTKYVQHSNNVEDMYLSPEKANQELNEYHIKNIREEEAEIIKYYKATIGKYDETIIILHKEGQYSQS